MRAVGRGPPCPQRGRPARLSRPGLPRSNRNRSSFSASARRGLTAAGGHERIVQLNRGNRFMPAPAVILKLVETFAGVAQAIGEVEVAAGPGGVEIGRAHV